MKKKTEIALVEKRKKQAKRIVFWFSILTLGSGYILYIALRFLFYEMAQQDKLVTLRADGEIKAIMRGDECVRYIMKVENHRIDPVGFDIFKGSDEFYAAYLTKAANKKREDPGFVERKLNEKNQLTEELKNAINEANSSNVFEEIFGVVWVGFPPYHVFTYTFRWLKYGQQKAQGGVPSDKVGIFAREEKVDSLFFRYPQYSVIVKDAETGAGSLSTTTENGAVIAKVQVEATFVFETVTVNPQKTLFRTAAISSAGDWQQALVREIADHVRKWLGSTDWDALVQGKKEGESDTGVEDTLKKIRDNINGFDEDGKPVPFVQISAISDYGQRVVKISMLNVDLKNTTLQTASEDVFKAEKKKDADIAKAKGDRALAAAPMLGKADGLEKISQLEGGVEMYMAEQLGKMEGVYAPGRDNMFLNIAAKATGGSRPSEKKTGGTDSSDDSGKKK